MINVQECECEECEWFHVNGTLVALQLALLHEAVEGGDAAAGRDHDDGHLCKRTAPTSAKK